MRYLFYDVATSLVAPVAGAWLALRATSRPMLARFAPKAPPLAGRPFWVHACSVGEVGVARPLLDALRQRHPRLPLVLTVSTLKGLHLAQKSCPETPLTWFPFDHRYCVRRFLKRLDPICLVLIETEIWPNVIRLARRFGIPVVLVNGRLSDKHFSRYRRFAWWFRPVFQQISAGGMQNEAYAQRIRFLGTPASVVRVTGNTKFDGVPTALSGEARARLRIENGFPEELPLVVFGSTRPGDESLAARCWQALRDEFPMLRLVIAPRHLERIEEALKPFQEPILKRSEVRGGRRPAGERVFVVDTLGELVQFYALATVAVIGGSFFPGVNGHNPLESAALGVATVFGPYMGNFMDPARVLLEADGAQQVHEPDALLPALRRLLSDRELRERLAARGRQAVLANQGAIGRTLDLLDPFVAQEG